MGKDNQGLWKSKKWYCMMGQIGEIASFIEH